ncbi:MAG: NAD(+)/NADH kinase [Solirubrobacterales bacterium]
MKVGLLSNSHKDETGTVKGQIINSLKAKGFEIVEEWAEGDPEPDVFIVLGGDGTILRAARRIAVVGIPLLAVNLGRIGFLSELEIDEVDSHLDALLSGDYRVEERMMLSVRVVRGKEAVYHSEALNEAAILKRKVSRTVYMKLMIDGVFFSDYVADGIICATPTGSTAYSLSAGGPVVLPDVDVTVVTPVCPYMLALKPLVADANRVLTIVPDARSETFLAVDGQEQVVLSQGDKVEIRRSESRVKLIKFKDRAFFDVLGKKLYRSGV